MSVAKAIAVAAVVVVAFGATAVVAQQDQIAARKTLMKANGKNAGAVSKMVKGQAPFDAVAVKAAFDQWDETAQKLPTLFPDGSKTDDTRALPAIWSDRAKFDAAIGKFKKDVDGNRATAMANLDGLKVALGVISKDCGGCHEAFRKPK